MKTHVDAMIRVCPGAAGGAPSRSGVGGRLDPGV